MSEPISSICRICGNSSGNTHWLAREMMYGFRDEFDYFQCAKCKALQIAEIPADMSKYYPSDYYSFNAYDGKKFKGIFGGFKRFQYKSSVLRKGFFQNLLHAIFPVDDYSIFRGFDIGLNSRILDVGCGNGRSFIYPLAETGFKNAVGCDPFISEQFNYANGLTIYKAGLEKINGEWDFITFHHSFEHIHNPGETLQLVSKLLKPGGVCVIRIPTVSSYAWEHYRINWAQLDAPRHFFLHSRESIELLAAQNGFELNKVVYDSRHFQFTGSEKYVADTALAVPRKKGLIRFLKRKWKKFQYARVAKKLNSENRGDQAGFFLRKI